MANCMIMTACIVMLLRLKSHPFDFLPHCLVLFCFMSHGRRLSWASFHLSIFSLCAVSRNNKSCFTSRNFLIDLGHTFAMKAASMEWQDVMHRSLNDQWSVLNNVQNTMLSSIMICCGTCWCGCLKLFLSWIFLNSYIFFMFDRMSKCQIKMFLLPLSII